MGRTAQTLLFLGIGTLLLGGVHYYLHARLVRDLELPAPWRQIATALVVVLFASIPLTFFFHRVLSSAAARWALWPVYIWMGLMLLLLALTLGTDLLRLVLLSTLRVARGQPLEPERRLWLARAIGAAVVTLGGALGAAAVREALGRLHVRTVKVPLAKLPRALDGFTIVQITDLHFGPTIGRAFAEEVVRTCNAESPDLIVITGDLVDGSVEELREIVAPLAGLRARHGVYFVTGNHEYYAGAAQWLAHLPSLGIRPLANERVTIGDGAASFDLAGVHDWSAGGLGTPLGPDLARALDGRDPARALVLLAHQPRQIAQAAALGVGLQLSGHTHGGQLWPWNYLVRLQQPYVAGLYRHAEAFVYVSCGTGYWGPPMRLGAPSEVTRIVLEHRTV